MPAWLQLLIAGLAVLLNAGALTGFIVWARSEITTTSSRVSKIEAEVAAFKRSCDERRGNIASSLDSLSTQVKEAHARLHERIDALIEKIGDNDSKVAKAIGRLEGKIGG